MPVDVNQGCHARLGQCPADVHALHQMCRQGRLYEVEGWIADGKPIQIAPEDIPKRTRYRSALEIALESGQHSLTLLLLRGGYRLELEPYSPLDLAMQSRRWDLVDLLLEWGAPMSSVDVSILLDTYNIELYERFRTGGYDLTQSHGMGMSLGLSASNRPLFGFAKRHRPEDPKIQRELDIALGYHARAGRMKGVSLCLWAGADPHARALNLEFALRYGYADEDDEDDSSDLTSIEEAANAGHLEILKRLGPDPARDNFETLYRYAGDEGIITFLATIRPPENLTAILASHIYAMGNPFLRRFSGARRIVQAIIDLGVQWSEADPKRLADIRQSLLKCEDCALRSLLSELKRPEVCAPETFRELTRTAAIQRRLIELGVLRKPVTERERRNEERERRNWEVERLSARYDRATLYEQVWSRPVQQVAEAYGVSGVWLGKVCRALHVPVPPRGYWARTRSGAFVRKPPLPKVNGGEEGRHRSSRRSGPERAGGR
jgi:ankyrin repeat protein